MPFKFVYISYGEPFYVYQNDEGDYCAMVYDKWIAGINVEQVTTEIDKHCYALMNIAYSHQNN